MLNRWVSHQQALKQCVGFWRAQRLSTMMTVLVIAIILMLPTLFWVVVENTSVLMKQWGQGGKILLFLDHGTSLVDQQSLLTTVRAMDGVERVKLISPGEGLQELQQQDQWGEMLRDLPDNPFPAVIEVFPAVSLHSNAHVERLYQQLRVSPHVEQAKLDHEWIERLDMTMHFFNGFSRGLMVLLGFSVLLMIQHTLQMVLHLRREEMQVLHLLGAPKSFILRPLLYAGVGYGAVGAILSLLIVSGLLVGINHLLQRGAASDTTHQLDFLFNVPIFSLAWHQILVIFMTAIGLGWMAARFKMVD